MTDLRDQIAKEYAMRALEQTFQRGAQFDKDYLVNLAVASYFFADEMMKARKDRRAKRPPIPPKPEGV